MRRVSTATSDRALPTDIESAHAMIRSLVEQVSRADRENDLLRQRIDQLCRRLFGRSSERVDPNQLVLAFLEAGALAAKPTEAPAEVSAAKPEPAPRTRKGHGRRKGFGDLPRQRFVNDLPEDQKNCGSCAVPLQKIGEDSKERLDYVPASVLILETVTPKYACPKCHDGVRKAASLPEPIEKGIAGPGLLAHVCVSKYADHLPLHRLEGILARHGVEISRKTMCDWVRDVANAIEPIWDELHRQILEAKLIQSDDTPVRVLEMKKPAFTGRFWVYRDPLTDQCVYEFTRSRERDGPIRFLGDFRGFLQADAYSGYDEVFRRGMVVEIGCWAHARRKVFESLESDRLLATTLLAEIRRLYMIEREMKTASSAERLARRQRESKPILAGIATLVEEMKGSVLPKSPLGQAIGYIRNQWSALSRYIEIGDAPIDNNGAERALRRIAVGRNNWLFAGSADGGRRGAILLTIMENCRAAGVDPHAYLRDVVMRVATHPASRVGELTPRNWKALLVAPPAEPIS